MLRGLAIATIVLSGEWAFSQSEYHFKHFSSEDGLASAYVQSIAQDSAGFLWIHYAGGLTRFDGYDFTVYKDNPENPERSPGDSQLSILTTDYEGNIWVMGAYQAPFVTIAKYDRLRDIFTKYKIRITHTIEGPNDGDAIRSVRFEQSGDSLWLGTRSGLYSFNINTHRTTHHWNDSPHDTDVSMANYVTDISVRDSMLLLSTRNGLWQFNKRRKQFMRPRCNPADSTWLYRAEIWQICETPNYDYNDVWLMSNNGFCKINQELAIVQRFDLPGGLYGFGLMDFVRDANGVLWIASVTRGLHRYNPLDGSFVNVRTLTDGNLFPDNTANSVFVDRDRNVWVATAKGITRLRNSDLIFFNHDIPKGDSSVLFSGIHSSLIFTTHDKDYLLINHYKRNDIHEILASPIVPKRLDSLNFASVLPPLTGRAVNNFLRGKHSLWIAMWGTGVIRIPLDPATGTIQRGQIEILKHDPRNKNTISSNFPVALLEAADGHLWVGMQDKGINKILLRGRYGDDGSVVRYKEAETDSNCLSSNLVSGLYQGDENTFWITTSAGVDLFVNENFKHVFKNKNEPRAFLMYDDRNIYIGTTAGLYEGVKKDHGYTFKKVTITKDHHILALQKDKLGRIWITTTQGIMCYAPRDNAAIEFTEKDGLRHWRSMYSTYVQRETRNGVIAISDYDGISIFDPLTFQISKKSTYPILTKLTINNEPARLARVGFENNTFTVNKNITVLDSLFIDYKHNNFSIAFSAMELTAPEKNRYGHKLDGYDKDWIETDARSRTATYTNLDAGTYTFRVKASNYHGIWNGNERKLTVIILPPPWQTWWAYSLYGLLFILVVLYWRRYEIKRIKLKQRAAHLTELDRLKAGFFANISHEFRTPLTLILAPLKDLYNKATGEDQRSLFATMMRNAERLRHLINQLLDLSKIEAGKMQLRVSRVDLVSLLREIASAYEPVAADKNIQFNFYPDASELNTYVDQEKIEKVIYNLLSNAFKFTTRGQVSMNLRVKGKQWIEIAVTDTGPGIAGQEREKIFDRFYQVDSSQTRTHEGSGLGMALAKELVELHRGKISVESVVGQGSTFTVLLPVSSVRKEEILHGIDQSEKGETWERTHWAVPITTRDENAEPATHTAEQPHILLVEDNADMRHYIRRTLAEHYHVLEAADGKEGVNKAMEMIPDLIISDVMMPGMDGYRVCESIKTNELTSHIPVILLTAKADRDSKLLGLETGADDYLTKPFDGDELKLIVRNRIEERHKLKERFSREVTLEPRHIAITSLDDKFLSRVMDIIEAHMDDEHFTSSALAIEAGYSNMQFYRKIKGLTAQSPNHFLRTTRLKRAAELLRHKSDNVAQIAYGVGFASQSYFIKCFKEQFGVTPGEYMQKQ